VIDKFNALLLEKEDDNNYSTPILQTEGVTFVYIKYNNVYLVATTNKNANVALVIQFLHKLANVSKRLVDFAHSYSYLVFS